MTTEEATRQYLLQLLRQYDKQDAEYLAEELDAAYLQQRLSELDTWATGWRKSIWGILAALGLVIMVLPVATNLGDEFFFAGVAVWLGELTMIYSWQRKKRVYRILAVMANPNVMADPDCDA